eukprot:Nk52_evm15s1763 gene=Nk52_evmTU15s1763
MSSDSGRTGYSDSSGIMSLDSGVVCKENTPQHPLLDDYELISSIERGKYGLVKNRETGVICFLKIIVKNDEAVPSSILLSRRDECRLMSKGNHFHICPLTDCIETKGSLYMVCKYFPKSLATSSMDGATAGQIHSIFSSLITGILNMEQENMTHASLSPSRVLLCEDYTVKICGMSHVIHSHWCLNESLQEHQEHHSITCFKAPEAREVECTYYGPAAHVYSLACILYYILNEKAPPAVRLQEYLKATLLCDNDISPLQRNLYVLMMSMCSEDPDERISTKEVQQIFERHMECLVQC